MNKDLRTIFEENGIDPFDVFLLDVSDWPKEAQDLARNNPAPRNTPTDPRDLTEEAARNS